MPERDAHRRVVDEGRRGQQQAGNEARTEFIERSFANMR